MIAFSLNVGGYAAEIIRSAIQSIPGPVGAAQTIGMGYVTSLRRIVLPQAARVAVPRCRTHSSPGEGHVAGVDDSRHRAVENGADRGRADIRVLRHVRDGSGLLLGDLLVLSFGQNRLENRLERYVAR